MLITRKRLCVIIASQALIFGTVLSGVGGELLSEEPRPGEDSLSSYARILRIDPKQVSLGDPQLPIKIMVPDSTINYTLKIVRPGDIYIPNALKRSDVIDPAPLFFQQPGQ